MVELLQHHLVSADVGLEEGVNVFSYHHEEQYEVWAVSGAGEGEEDALIEENRCCSTGCHLQRVV